MTCACPGRLCKPCEANRPCAYVLQLDVAQERQLSRILEIVGENPSRGTYTRSTTKASTLVAADLEPVSTLACDKCGRESTMLTYLHEFLRGQHVRIPCPVCVSDRRAA